MWLLLCHREVDTICIAGSIPKPDACQLQVPQGEPLYYKWTFPRAGGTSIEMCCSIRPADSVLCPVRIPSEDTAEPQVLRTSIVTAEFDWSVHMPQDIDVHTKTKRKKRKRSTLNPSAHPVDPKPETEAQLQTPETTPACPQSADACSRSSQKLSDASQKAKKRKKSVQLSSIEAPTPIDVMGSNAVAPAQGLPQELSSSCQE